MMDEMDNPVHVPWFKQAYRKYAKGVRFADSIPGQTSYEGLTLTHRAQPYRITGGPEAERLTERLIVIQVDSRQRR